MIDNIFILAVSLFLVIKGATLSTKYAARFAESFHLSKYTVGFIIVAIISILPEALVGINSAIAGIPSFGLGTLFGSNVADLTVVFTVIIILAGRGIKVESKILKKHNLYPFLLLLPLLLGLDGYFSRLEGLVLIVTGGVFYYISLKNGLDDAVSSKKDGPRYRNFLMLIVSMAILLLGAHFTVSSATGLARDIGVNPIFIGMLIVGLGTTIPELFFSLKSVKKHDDDLAIGDIFGTVLADATVLVGVIALIDPFYFPKRIIFVTGLFMVTAAVVLLYFMRTGRRLTKREAYLLFVFWIIFIAAEYLANR